VSDLYCRDFFTWTQQQARAIRESAWHELDREHLAEEVGDMWHRDSRRLRDALRDLVTWALAWSHSPQARKAHPWWYVRIENLRVDIDVILDLWPNLKAQQEAYFTKAYAQGRTIAAQELGLPNDHFPEVSPWTFDEMFEASLDGPASPFLGGHEF
jgi:hypothetical protein